MSSQVDPSPVFGQHWCEAAYNANHAAIILNLSESQLERALSLQAPPLTRSLASHDPGHRAPLADRNPTSLALRSFIETTLTVQPDYEAVAIPLSNSRWRARWERMCVDRSDAASQPQGLEDLPDETAENWRKEGAFLSSELNVTNSSEVNRVVCLAADWLELDSPVEGIRFDCELVSPRPHLLYLSTCPNLFPDHQIAYIY